MEQTYRIDLNSDVGESFGVYKIGLDEEVIPLISSANIACGFHAGDPAVMRRTIALAKEHGVAVGAHPGFPDLIGFGRRNMDATLEEIRDYVTYQVGALQAFATQQRMKLQHVKAHGALYNMAAQDERIGEAIVDAVSRLDKELILVFLPGPKREEFQEIGKRYGIRIAFEFFADREYNPDGSLVSRREPGAVIEDRQQAAERVLQMVTEKKISAQDGTQIEVAADTICVHGDNPAAVRLVKHIRESLLSSGIEITPMGQFL
ncbi:MAG: 5-oxoprolinase subunit PxpA [Proteobacteria bacterium]|nr:5-oxoprolinase subunit PxpA [Pseudomonadota bacterium]